MRKNVHVFFIAFAAEKYNAYVELFLLAEF